MYTKCWKGNIPFSRNVSSWNGPYQFFISFCVTVSTVYIRRTLWLALYRDITAVFCEDHDKLTPWSTVLPEKLTSLQLVKKFPAFYGTRRFITSFTSARHLSLSWSSPIQCMPPHPTSSISILTLPSHLRLGFPSGLFPSGLPTKTSCTRLFSTPNEGSWDTQIYWTVG
jgi:hypothetical protein